jgi:hypothetical protein
MEFDFSSHDWDILVVSNNIILFQQVWSLVMIVTIAICLDIGYTVLYSDYPDNHHNNILSMLVFCMLGIRTRTY